MDCRQLTFLAGEYSENTRKGIRNGLIFSRIRWHLKINTYKINLSMPYRLLASGLMPTYRREHPEQPATGLPLIFRLAIAEKDVKGRRLNV